MSRRIFVVVAELRTAVVVREGHDGVHVLAVSLAPQSLGQLAHNAVDASHGRDYPYLVANPDVAVLALITLESQTLVRRRDVDQLRVVAVFEQAVEVGFDVVLVHPLAFGLGLAGMTDRITVFDHIFALGQILERKLVTGRHVRHKRHLGPVDHERLAGLQVFDGNGHIVVRINLNKSCSHCSLFFVFKKALSSLLKRRGQNVNRGLATEA